MYIFNHRWRLLLCSFKPQQLECNAMNVHQSAFNLFEQIAIAVQCAVVRHQFVPFKLRAHSRYIIYRITETIVCCIRGDLKCVNYYRFIWVPFDPNRVSD